MSYRYDTVPVHKAASGSRKKLGAILACKSTVNWVWYAESKVESERSKLISISCTKTARITPVEQLANITSIGHVLSPVLVVCGSSLINLSHFFRPEIISDPSPTLLTTPFPISSAWRPHHWLSLSLSLSSYPFASRLQLRTVQRPERKRIVPLHRQSRGITHA